jgi:hypothetical protein
MKTQLLRTSIFALLAAAAVYAESTPELRPQVQGITNSTIPLTMMPTSLALGASPAEMPAGVNDAKEHHNLAEWIQVGPEGVIAAKDPAEQRQPVRLNLPSHVDRENPRVLMAPCVVCSKPSPFSAWQQFQMALSVLYWI